jgi:hypothetical protein
MAPATDINQIPDFSVLAVCQISYFTSRFENRKQKVFADYLPNTSFSTVTVFIVFFFLSG